MEERKTPMLIGAKTAWSQPTRARMVAFVFLRLTWRTRNSYHFVAAGPKMTGAVVRHGLALREWREREGKRTSTICSHTSCSHDIMFVKPSPLDALLCHSIARRKQNLCIISTTQNLNCSKTLAISRASLLINAQLCCRAEYWEPSWAKQV